MTTHKRPSRLSLSADICDHQEKRPKVEDKSSTQTVDSETQQETLPDDALETVQNAFPTLDEAIESVEEAYTTSAVPPPRTSPSEPDGFVFFSDPSAQNGQATIDNIRPHRDGRSPSPSGDTRIPLWWDETRAFKGDIIIATRKENKQGSAGKVARQAQKAPLMVDGKPQFNLFVDGSYQSPQNAEPKILARGGYGVVFRNPYHGQGAVEFDHGHGNEAWNNTRPELNTQEDDLGRNDFNIRSWRSHRVYSSRHAEMAAVSQALETVIAIVKRQQPSSGVSVSIFSDCKDVINRIARPRVPESEGMTDADALSMPLVRAIVWQSHYLFDEWDCKIKLRWLPRCCVLAHRLADHVAGWWKSGDKHESADGAGVIFQQKDRPVWRRDGILDALHGDLTKVVDRIKKREINRPARSLRAPKLKRQEGGDMLDRFAGSAVQTSFSSDSLLEMPPIWERSGAFEMVNEDMAKVLKGRPSEDE